ncbi:MAG: phosphoribosyltransferase family protein, partial [Aggregatilineales bacterium]
SVETLTQNLLKDTRIAVVVPVPSLRRPQLTPVFAKSLADKLHLPYSEAVTHVEQHPSQEDQNNSHQQALNVLDRYKITGDIRGKTVLLVDDIADSKWTLTMIGELLGQSGAKAVYPFVLAVKNPSG